MATSWYVGAHEKHPDSAIKINFPLEGLGSATINATVTPDSTPAGLTLAAVVTGSTVTVLVSGGTNNTKYRVDVPITLVESNARVAVAEFDVHVRDR